MEPYIYHYLIEQNITKLNDFWKNWLPPLQNKFAYVIVERRPHPNFEFILKNIAWAGPGMAVYIFCSDVNIGFIKAILGTKVARYNIRAVFTGLGTRESGKIDYNKFLTNAETYRMIDAEYIMTVQMDTIFRRALPDEIFTGDYWGNPWAWKPDFAGGGGATIRKISAMISLCERFTHNIAEAEDSWLSDRINEIGGNVPPLSLRANMIMESIPTNNPYVLHQFWTFLEQYMGSRESFIGYWKHLLTLG